MKDEWTTPPRLFSYLDNLYNFTLDAAATKENALCSNFFTMESNALKQDWGRGDGYFHSVFCNPPYSMAREFAEYAHLQYRRENGPRLIVMLLPVRSDRIWFQELLREDLLINQMWITGRLHFGGSGKGAFMYNVLFGWGVQFKARFMDASEFNNGGLGGAKS